MTLVDFLCSQAPSDLNRTLDGVTFPRWKMSRFAKWIFYWVVWSHGRLLSGTSNPLNSWWSPISHRKGYVTLGQKFVVFDDSENRLFCLSPQFQHFLPSKASFDWRLFAMPGQAKHLTFRWSKTGRVDLKLDLFLGISIRTIWHRIKNIKLLLFWHYTDEIFWYMSCFDRYFYTRWAFWFCVAYQLLK